jgi:hypothetical protein
VKDIPVEKMDSFFAYPLLFMLLLLNRLGLENKLFPFDGCPLNKPENIPP